MKTALYYYTGTGNSLWIAKELSAIIESDTTIQAMKLFSGEEIEADAVGLIFPVHIWGVPHPVIDFINKLPSDKSKYYFAIATNGGQVAGTLLQAKMLMEKRDMTLDSGYGVIMPSNYIAWGGPGSPDLLQSRFENAKRKLADIAYTVEKKYPTDIEKGPSWQRILFGLVYKMSFNKVSSMDSSFWADEKCNQCGLCAEVCPTHNIVVKDKPEWHHQCEQCMACIQWCPTFAIQYGKKTAAYERYHQPEITVNDIMNSVPKN